MILGAVSLLCVLGGVFFTLCMAYFFFEMWTNARPEKKYLLPFIGPVILIFPQLWNERGNRARRNLIASGLLFLMLFAIAYFIRKKMP